MCKNLWSFVEKRYCSVRDSNTLIRHQNLNIREKLVLEDSRAPTGIESAQNNLQCRKSGSQTCKNLWSIVEKRYCSVRDSNTPLQHQNLNIREKLVLEENRTTTRIENTQNNLQLVRVGVLNVQEFIVHLQKTLMFNTRQ